KRRVPGPKPLPLMGSFPGTFFQKKHIVDEIDAIYKQYKHSTRFVGLFYGRSPQLMLLDAVLIKDTLIKDFQSFHDNEFGDLIDKTSDPILSQNPFVLCGAEWKEKRAEITPAFTIARVKAMFPIFDDICHKMKNYVTSKLEQKLNIFDVGELAAKYSTDVVSSVIYGIDSKSFENAETNEIRENGSSIFESSSTIVIYFTIVSIFPFMKRLYKVVPKSVEQFFQNLLSEAIKLREASNIKREDFLSYLLDLKEKKNLSKMDMTSHTITIFLDGLETSTAAITYALYHLARNVHVQQKLRAEINENIQVHGCVSYDLILEMEYLDQVFNETLRLNPPFGTFSKRCNSAIDFSDHEGNTFTLDKDKVAIVPVYSLHMDPDYFPKPDVFDPDRFSQTNGGTKKYKDKGVFLPFGDGPRICLGMRFATFQTKAAIVEIIRHFDVSVNKETKWPLVFDPSKFLLTPQNKIWLDFRAL
ncbi:putative cytochrome P450 28a5, partial [Pseudolycoriella hygida]